MQPDEDLITLGQIAKATGLKTYTVDYILRSRGIEETRRAGTIRLFDRRVIGRVMQERSAMLRSPGREAVA